MNFSSRKYKYIIVDSQIEDINSLRQHLEDYPNFYCVGIAKCKSEAINLILEEQPKLVFFNTELLEGMKIINSFEVISELRQYLDFLPQFIAMNFSTKDSYQAIKNGVFDYILKPFNHFELKKTLLRFEKNQPESSSICLKSFTEYIFLSAKDILFLKADNNTTDFHLKDGSIVMCCQTLKSFEKTLPNIFVRIHKSYMVNVTFIAKIHFSKFQCVLKFTKQVIPFSKNLKPEMLEIRDFLVNLPSESYA
ncbi:MAG: DNA-binding LytR/AlgR family response regulator [Polaribacter sp.]